MVFNRDNKKESIFRKESLERLSSPERLDRLMQVTIAKDWVALTVFGSLTVVGLVWSVVGRIPVTVEGRGVFIQPRQVIEFQSSIAGQLKSLNLSGGLCIKKNEVLATVDPVELREQLRLTQQKLAQLQQQTQDALSVSGQRMQLEKSAVAASRTSLAQGLRDARSLTPVLKEKGLKAIKQQRISLQQRLKEAQQFTPALKDKGLTAISQQRISLQQRLQDARGLVPLLQERLQKRRELAAAGGISADSILQTEQEYKESVQKISELQAQLKQLDLTEIQTQQSYQQSLNTMAQMQAQLQELEVQSAKNEREYLDNLRSIRDIQAQLQELDTKGKRWEQENLETSIQRNKEMQEVTREISRMQHQISENSRILSPQDGCILELTATLGQVVQPGTRLGTMKVGSSAVFATGMAYFPIKYGKQIQPGMSISITPDTVQRERYGGIMGKTTYVSSLPVTREGMVSAIGNADVVKSLSGDNSAVIEVTADLVKDASTVSGYKWSSSKGPQSKITPGTTATVRVTVEERAPITFVLPILREFSGMK